MFWELLEVFGMVFRFMSTVLRKLQIVRCFGVFWMVVTDNPTIAASEFERSCGDQLDCSMRPGNPTSQRAERCTKGQQDSTAAADTGRTHQPRNK